MHRLVVALALTALLAACDDASGGGSPRDVGTDATASDAADAVVTDATATTADATETAVTDATETAVTDADADVTTAAASKLGLDYAALPSGAAARYDPAGASWLDVPWPSDRWRAEDHHLDLSNLPLPVGSQLVDAYREVGETALRGWGCNGAGYVAFDGPLDRAALPTPAATREALAPIQLIDLSSGPRRGERHPIALRLYEDLPSAWVPAHTLAFRPVLGTPLDPNTTYCFLATRALVDAAGHHLDQPAGLAAELAAGTGGLAPLRAWLAEEGAPFAAIDLAAATCFTTDDPAADLFAIRAALASTSPPTVSGLTFQATRSLAGGDFDEYTGRYDAPNFQRGDPPYATTGGEFVFDGDGHAVPQRTESMRYVVWVPPGPAPDTGWPLVVYSHGTGGDYLTCTRDIDAGPILAGLGLAMICIDQPLSGDRGGSDGDWANYANPWAARTTIRQSAIDNMTLVRGLRAGRFDIEAGAAHGGDAVVFDPARVYFYGHSQGALTGALALAVVPELRAAVISSGGGVLMESALGREDAQAVIPVMAVAFDEQVENVDDFHPILSLLQMLGDAADPVNYGRYWLASVDGWSARHVIMTAGSLDPYTPLVTANALAASAGIPIALPTVGASEAHGLMDLEPIALPTQGDVTTADGERTAVLFEVAGEGHFVSFDPRWSPLWTTFLTTMATTGEPVVPAP